MAEKKYENGKKSEKKSEISAKYRNFCESCAHSGTKKCENCEDGYDGIPGEYKFELSAKTPEELRREVLEQAIRCVCTDRKAQYGSAEDSFAVIGDLWSVYLRAKCIGAGADVTVLPEDVCNLMVLFKMGRAATAMVQKIDTYVDMAGYAACAGGMIDE